MQRLWLGFVALGVVAGLAWIVGGNAVRAEDSKDVRTLLKRAEESLRLKNYNEAISLAEKIKSGSPTEEQFDDADRIAGMSEFGLGNLFEAYKTLSGLIERRPALDKDAAVVEVLALSSTNANASVERIVALFNRAADLYKAEGNARKQFDLIFHLAELYDQQRLSENAADWRVQMIHSVIHALETYDRALDVAKEKDNQIRTIHAKIEMVLRYGMQIKQIAEEKWPQGLAYDRGDLTKPFDLAIEFDREIVRRFPEDPSAADALLQIAEIQTNSLVHPLAALDTLAEVVAKFPRLKQADLAKKRIGEIKAPVIGISIPDIGLPGSKVKLEWSAVNVATIQLEAYPIDLFKALRKTEEIGNLTSYAVTGDPIAKWTIDTHDKKDHLPTSNGDTPVEAPLSDSNAYLVIARGSNPEGKKTEAKAIAIISKLALVAKTGKSKSEFFAVDALTGEPRPKVDLLVQRFLRQVQVPVLKTWKRVFDYKEVRIPDSGLLEFPLPNDAENRGSNQLVGIARDGNDYAITDGQHWGGWWGFANGIYSYTFTDRPVYRPGQLVNFKLILRSYSGGEYHVLAGESFHVVIRDPRGATVFENDLVTTDEGSVSGQLTLGDEAALGMYSIQALRAMTGVSTGAGARFRVEEYKKPEFDVTVETAKNLYKVGDELTFKIHGEYYFGGPVAGAKVTYTIHREAFYPFIPWPRPYGWLFDDSSPMPFFHPSGRSDLIKRGELVTDAEGNANVSVITEAFANAGGSDLQYRIEVEMVDESRREIKATQTIKVTKQAFTISLHPKQHLYQPGDTVRVELKSENPNRQPVPFDGTTTISFVEQRELRDESGKITQEEKLQTLEAKSIKVGDRGTAVVEFTADKEGLFKVVVETPDPFNLGGAKISGSAEIWVAKAKGAMAHYANRDLEVVLEQETYQVGQTLRMLVNCRQENSYVLLTAEGDDIYRAEVVYVEGNQAVVEWPIVKSLQPSVAIKAVTIRGNTIFQEEKLLYVPPVEQFLTVKIVAPKDEFRPREQADITIEVTDFEGRPAANAEVSLAAFDASILYIQPELREDIRKFFYGRNRPVSVQTTSSYFFRSWTHNANVAYGYFDTPRRMGRGVGGAHRMGRAMEKAMPAPMAALAEAGEGAADDLGLVAPTEVRSDFRDSIYWAAHLVTGSDGKAKAHIQFPDSLTTWKLTAIGSDLQTRVGEVSNDVRTKKNILVRLQAPRFLIEGDRVVLSANVHNYLDHAKKVRVDMTDVEGLSLLAVNSSVWTQVGLDLVLEKKAAVVDVEVTAGGEKRVDFVFAANRVGTISATVKSLTDEESDAMRLEFPCYEYGSQKLIAESGILFGQESDRTTTAQLLIPEEIRRDSQSLTVQVSPTIAGVMLESLPYLLEYPYGCTEQTLSRFVPAVLTAHTLKTLGMDLSTVAKIKSNDKAVQERLERIRKNPVVDQAEMARMIKAGIRRLADFQHGDGGWGWWKQGESTPYLTAYVVTGLVIARDSGVSLPDGMIDRGVNYLVAIASRPDAIKEYPWQVEENTSLRAYLLYAIGRADSRRLQSLELSKQVRRIFDDRDKLTDYARATLAITLADAGLREESLIVLGNIKDRARLDDDSNTASWGDARGYYYWYQCGTEATSFSLKALVRLEPDSPMIPKVVNWLVRHRQGTRWFSTKDTAIACDALADYLRMTGELDPDLTIRVQVDGRESLNVRVTKENLFTFQNELKLTGEELGTGSKSVTILAHGRGNVYWGAYAEFFTKESQIKADGNEIFVTRQYQRLLPKEVTKTRKVWDSASRKQVDETYKAIEYDRAPIADGDKLESGDLIEVTLAIDAKNNFEYLLFEDPKPAGCETTELRSGYQWGSGFGAHTELRDEKVAFFATYLNQGKHQIRYRLRAEIPGEFHALPARGECMYTPFVQGNGDSAVIKIVDQPAK